MATAWNNVTPPHYVEARDFAKSMAILNDRSTKSHHQTLVAKEIQNDVQLIKYHHLEDSSDKSFFFSHK